MIGKIILWIKKFIKQQFCVHKWKYIQAGYRTNGSCPDFEMCKKCGITK